VRAGLTPSTVAAVLGAAHPVIDDVSICPTRKKYLSRLCTPL